MDRLVEENSFYYAAKWEWYAEASYSFFELSCRFCAYLAYEFGSLSDLVYVGTSALKELSFCRFEYLSKLAEGAG